MRRDNDVPDSFSVHESWYCAWIAKCEQFEKDNPYSNCSLCCSYTHDSCLESVDFWNGNKKLSSFVVGRIVNY